MMRPFTFSLKHWHSGWHKGSLPKSLSSDNDLKPNLRYFVRILRYTLTYMLRFKHFLEIFGQKKFFLGGVKNSASLARSTLLHGIHCILYWVKFPNMQLRGKTSHLSRNEEIRVWQKLLWPFLALAERLPTSATLLTLTLLWQSS